MKRNLSARKLMSVLLLMVMLMSMLPAAYAEGGTDATVIKSFAADVPLCAVIGEPCTGYKRDNSDEGYTAEGTWLTDGKAVAETDTFQENVQYTYHLVVKPREGYKLADGFTHDYGRGFVVGHPDKNGNYVNDFYYLPVSAAPGAKVIDELTVSLPAAPEAGAEARQTWGIKENEYIYNMYWYEDDTRLLDRQQFEANTVYSAKYEFETTNGCTFAEKVKINGLGKEPIYAPRTDETKLTYSHIFPAAGSSDGDSVIINISYVNLEGPKAPVTGEAVSSYSATGTGYTAEGKWFVGENEFTGDKFAPETEYTLAVTITAVEGFSFKDLESVTMDGETMSFTRGLADAEVLHFSKTYPATAGQPKPEPEIEPVAKIVRDGKDVLYETLDKAFADAKDKETIIVLKDCATSWDKGQAFGKTLTLDGGNHTVSFSAGFCVTAETVFTLKNITLNMPDIKSGNNGDGPSSFYAIVVNPDAEFNIENSVVNLSGGSGDGIYSHLSTVININASTVNISGMAANGITKDNGTCYLNISGGSALNISGNGKGGITNTWNITVDGSTLNVKENRGNGSNGSNYYIKNDSAVNYINNGGHGISAGDFVVEGSKVTADGNKYYGITATGDFSVDGKSSVQAAGNGAGYIGGGLRLTDKSPNGIVKSGAVLKINNNLRNGIENYRNTVIEEGVAMEVMNNTEPNFGGGIFNAASISLPSDAKIYNNHAGDGGDDIANTGEEAVINLGPVGSDWKLDGTEGTNDCLRAIDGWYRDEEELESPAAPMAAAAGITFGRWNAHSLEKLFVEKVEPGRIEGYMDLKAAHGIGEKKTETPSEIRFVKTDSMTGKPIKGAQFTLYSDEALKTVKASYVSDEKGEFVIRELPGSYYLKETKPAAGYKDNNTVYHVYIRPEIIEDKFALDTSVTPNEVYSSVKSVSYGYVDNMEPERDGRYLIENDIINEKTIEIKKIWRDKEGMRARTGSVEVALYADKAEYEVFTLCDDNNWSIKLTVPKYDETGKEIKYTVKELTQVKDYNVSYDGLNVINTHRLYNPKTGDESNIWLWVGILAAAAVAAGVVSYVLIKKRKTDN